MRAPIADRLVFADEPDGDPVVAEARVLVEGVLEEAVAREGAAHLLEDVLVAVVVEVGERDGVALLEVAEAARGRDVREAPCRGPGCGT